MHDQNLPAETVSGSKNPNYDPHLSMDLYGHFMQDIYYRERLCAMASSASKTYGLRLIESWSRWIEVGVPLNTIKSQTTHLPIVHQNCTQITPSTLANKGRVKDATNISRQQDIYPQVADWVRHCRDI